METLKTINFVIAVIFFVCYTYQFLYIPVPWLRKARPHGPAKDNRYAVLICARNEQRVIGDLIASLRGQTYSQGLLSIFVLADNCTDETVCLLSKLQSKEHIEIEVKMDELDLTSAESKATYEEIREYVFEHTGLKVSHLYIAQVKQKYGIIERENYNKPKSEDTRQPQCPPEKEKAITEALKHFGMI